MIYFNKHITKTIFEALKFLFKIFRLSVIRLISLILLFSIIFDFLSCKNNSTDQSNYFDRKVDTIPPKTIAIGELEVSYPYPNTNEGYELAGKELKNPIIKSKENLDKGKKLYLGHCKHCHGVTGNADAPMIIKEKYPPPPKFQKRLKIINEGKMFHSITYGKNLMPSNLYELDTEEKWLLVNYIQTISN